MQGINIRVKRSVDEDKLRIKAATSAIKFIRRQAEATRPQSKLDLIRGMWRIYFRLRRSHLLVAPITTRRLLRRTYGYWKTAGVVTSIT